MYVGFVPGLLLYGFGKTDVSRRYTKRHQGRGICTDLSSFCRDNTTCERNFEAIRSKNGRARTDFGRWHCRWYIDRETALLRNSLEIHTVLEKGSLCGSLKSKAYAREASSWSQQAEYVETVQLFYMAHPTILLKVSPCFQRLVAVCFLISQIVWLFKLILTAI